MRKYRALKVRLYANQDAYIKICKNIGCSRFVYNSGLAERRRVYEELKDDKEALYDYKYKSVRELREEFEWLKEVDSQNLECSTRDLHSAYENFFNSLQGKRKGKVNFPKFHKKGHKDSYRTPRVRIDWELRKIRLSKIGWINFRDKRLEKDFEGGRLKSATISKTKTGKLFASLLFEFEVEEPKKFEVRKEKSSRELSIKGLDMSLDRFYVDEEGNSPSYQRLYRKTEKEIAYLQSKLSRKQKGSNNRRKAQLRINKKFEKIANSRKDFIEKLSTKLINENDVIVIEGLDLREMSQFPHLGKSIMDLGWRMFSQRLQQKAEERGKLIIKADKWFASSKTCHVCGHKVKDLALNEREWTCPSCGAHLLRDQNAALNLVNYGLKIMEGGAPLTACGDTGVTRVDEAGSLLLEVAQR